jgi:hypothetical protein
MIELTEIAARQRPVPERMREYYRHHPLRPLDVNGSPLVRDTPSATAFFGWENFLNLKDFCGAF